MLTTVDLCELKGYLDYVLGFGGLQSSLAMTKGSCIHKAFELLGRKQLAERNGLNCFFEPELNKFYNPKNITFETAINDSLVHYIIDKGDLTTNEIPECKKWFYDTIEKYPEYTPIKRKVKAVEQYFDIPLEFEWAKYEFWVEKEKIEGQLAIRGSMDLILECENGLEYSDFKTGGSCKEWATGKTKTSESLKDDIQLMLYYYALRKTYPDIKHILMTLLFIRAGGPLTAYFDDSDIPRIENELKKRFERIKSIEKPKNIKKGMDSFKCKWCAYSKERFNNPDNKYNRTYCDFFERELTYLGMDKVTNKYIDLKKFGKYQDGGGRTAKEE